MNFFKKLFFWSKSNQIRKSDTKCCPTPIMPISYKFPRRDFYNSAQPHTKLYRNQSSSTYDLSVDSSVQCEISEPLVWHKKSNKKTHKKSKSRKNIDSNTSTNNFVTPSIDISIDLPRKPKKLQLIREINLTGIEDFVKKPRPQKIPIEFVFDDQVEDLSDKEPKKIDFSKLKTTRSEPSSNQLIIFQHDDDKTTHDNKDLDNEIHSVFTQNSQNETQQNLTPSLNLPKPKGCFVFDENGDSNDEI